MGKNKLRKFAAMAQMPCVVQCTWATLKARSQGNNVEKVAQHELRGRWAEDFFHNSLPIILELGCGHGEYTAALAAQDPTHNYIGIDIKGARMYTGAREVMERGLTNAAFLRTNIELLPMFFAPGEVSEIWITFPDPQMKKVTKRLTSTAFLSLYRRITAAESRIHLKTDSPFLYTYTRRLIEQNGLPLAIDTSDLYASDLPATAPARAIQTHYERQWLSRGLSIKYLVFSPGSEPLTEPPSDDIPLDTYRSYARGQLEMKNDE